MRLTQRILIGLTVLVMVGSSNAQTRISRRIEGDGAFHLKELQSIITSANDTVKIMAVMPANLRAEKYQDIELKENDEILMVNAKRVKTVQEFEKIYNDLEIGGTLKLGLRRNGQLQLESFEKIDPEDLPSDRNVMIRLDDDGEDGEGEGDWTEDTHGDGQPMTRTIRLGGEEGMRPLFGTGLILAPEGDKVKISNILDGMTDALGDADVEEGDILTEINGEKIKKMDHFFKVYDNLKTGEKVKLAYARGDQKMVLTFTKPEAQGRMMMRRN